MPDILDDVAYLSQEIGPRPAGTEEEQQAALYINERLQKDAGLDTSIEDFACITQSELVTYVCFGASFLFMFLSLFVPALTIPAFIVALVCAVLFALEEAGKPVLSRFLSRGVSQNVIARYEPVSSTAKRARKVVLVSHYDSGKVQSEASPRFVGLYGYARKASGIALLVAPLFLLIRGVFFLYATGGGATVLNVIAAVILILMAVSLVVSLLHQFAAYNEAANSNAAGVAVMLEVASLLGKDAAPSFSDDAVVHGTRAAREAQVLPDDVELVYEIDDSTLSEEERLASAKAAIAAITGTPVAGAADHVADLSEHLVQVKKPPMQIPDDEELVQQRAEVKQAFSGDDSRYEELEDEQGSVFEPEPEGVDARHAARAAQEQAPAQQGVPTVDEAVEEDDDDVPAWYKAAQKKASRPESSSVKPEQRSRFTSALDAAVEQSGNSFARAAEAADALVSSIQQPMGVIELLETKSDNRSDEQAQSESPTDETPTTRQPREEREATDAEPASDAQADDGAPSQKSAVRHEDDQAELPVRMHPLETEGRAASDSIEDATEYMDEVDEEEVAYTDYRDASSVSSIPPISTGSVRRARARTRQDPSPADSVREAASDLLSKSGKWADRVKGRIANAGAEEGEDARKHSFHISNPFAGRSDSDEDNALFYDDEDSTEVMEPLDTSTMGSRGAHTDDADADDIDRAQVSYRDVADTDKRPSRSQIFKDVASSGPDSAPFKGFESMLAEDEPQEAAQPVMTAQPAPLADVEENPTPRTGLSGRIPLIGVEVPQVEQPADREEGDLPDNKRAALRSMLPSLSGPMNATQEAIDEQPAEEANSSVSLTGSFAAVGATGTFDPVGDELVADVPPEEVYIDDADDSSFETETTETGAYAGPGYVEMPKSRAGRFFGKFRHNKTEESSTQDWLQVDEDFDARTVGKNRGGWESFRQDSEFEQDIAKKIPASGDHPAQTTGFVDIPVIGYDEDDTLDDFDDFDDDDFGEAEGKWNGGAFSKVRSRFIKDEEADGAMDDPFAEDAPQNEWEQEEEPVDSRERHEVHSETSRVRTFHGTGGSVSVEVWCVALGSELSGNGGMKALLAEHSRELRGAFIVDLDALGAGELCFVESEGAYLATSPSSRLKRYAAKASKGTGLPIGTAIMNWKDSATTEARKLGFQAMSLVGIDGNKPALFAQGDDVLEAIDETTLHENADFVLEMLRHI